MIRPLLLELFCVIISIYLRPHHFDVGVCVIPKFFLEIFGAEKKFPE
jgi:hypothetical protein